MLEAWKPVVGFPGYWVSETGRVRSDPMIYRNRHGQDAVRAAMLLTPDLTTGYARVTLRLNGRGYKKLVHRLVCEAFNGPPPSESMLCRHLDDVKENIRPENLAWGTYADNGHDAVKNGRKACRDSGNGRAKLSKSDVKEILDLRANGALCSEIAKRFNISDSWACALVSGKDLSQYKRKTERTKNVVSV